MKTTVVNEEPSSPSTARRRSQGLSRETMGAHSVRDEGSSDRRVEVGQGLRGGESKDEQIRGLDEKDVDPLKDPPPPVFGPGGLVRAARF
jgi:hypothetical protein